MAGSGPQKYPGASTAYFYQNRWGGDLMEVNVCVLHTTEGVGLSDYSGGAMAPNLTAIADFKNRRLRWYQHFDIDRSSRALQNLSGGVETNTLNVVQVELEGTCDYSHRETWGSRVAGKDYIYWGNPPDWALQDLADFLRWLNANHGVPLTGPSMWLNYGPDARRPGVTPASYGASPARMSFSAWNGFKGICGHQHVPENVHGDPGALPFSKLITLAKGSTPPAQEHIVADASDVKTLFQTDNVLASPDGDKDASGNKYWTAESYLRYGYLQDRTTQGLVKDLDKKLGALQATGLTDAQVQAIADKVAASPALAEQIAEKVATKLAARLAQ